MPELPDIVVYVEALERRIGGQALETIQVANPFLLRTVDPPLSECQGRRVIGLRRVGKRIAIGLENDLYLVIHLMIAGRLHWAKAGAKPPGKRGLAAFGFTDGTLILTEAGSKRRAALHVVRGPAGLRDLGRGGVEPLETDQAGFMEALRRENHTLKRSLTDPRLFSGIGNAYSDEILFRSGLSPVALSQNLSQEDSAK